MKNLWLASLLLLLSLPNVLANPQNKKTAAAPAPAPFGNVEGITAAQMKDYLEFIASDELEGRDTPSRGLDIAAKYIASHLSRWGLKPAGDNGTFFQSFPLRRTKIDPTNTWGELNGKKLAFGDDFYVPVATPGTFRAPLVYVGNGWLLKAKNINPYQGLTIKDRIVLLSTAPPKGMSQADLQGIQGEDWSDPISYCKKHGAKAVLVIPSMNSLAGWKEYLKDSIEKPSLGFDNPVKPVSPELPIAIVSPRLLAALFQGEKSNGAIIYGNVVLGEPLAGFELNPNKLLTLQIAAQNETVYTRNVVAVLEGSDPVLKNEYVAIGAHYDHIGLGNPINGDKINNGADDDGSGTVAVMAMAEAFAKGAQRPKRSILFVWHAGEEHGLWGSEYITEKPPVPITQIITQLNLDMVGRAKASGDNTPANKDLAESGEVFVVGSKMMSTELGELSERVNNSYLKLKFNYKFDDPNDPERIFYRSDHFNYARKGVPIIFYNDGSHADYHQPSDSIEKIDFQQMEKIARTVFATAWELSNRPTRPRVDKPLPASVAGN